VLILNFIITNAQENHITLLKSSGINFIPADMIGQQSKLIQEGE
jgi:hypothetical protein